jgi:hypothetical protein
MGITPAWSAYAVMATSTLGHRQMDNERSCFAVTSGSVSNEVGELSDGFVLNTLIACLEVLFALGVIPAVKP